MTIPSSATARASAASPARGASVLRIASRRMSLSVVDIETAPESLRRLSDPGTQTATAQGKSTSWTVERALTAAMSTATLSPLERAHSETNALWHGRLAESFRQFISRFFAYLCAPTHRWIENALESTASGLAAHSIQDSALHHGAARGGFAAHEQGDAHHALTAGFVDSPPEFQWNLFQMGQQALVVRHRQWREDGFAWAPGRRLGRGSIFSIEKKFLIGCPRVIYRGDLTRSLQKISYPLRSLAHRAPRNRGR